MTAYDTAEPSRKATADVTVLVQRNANAPQFTQDDYRIDLDETTALGEPLITMEATDEDGVSTFKHVLCFPVCFFVPKT